MTVQRGCGRAGASPEFHTIPESRVETTGGLPRGHVPAIDRPYDDVISQWVMYRPPELGGRPGASRDSPLGESPLPRRDNCAMLIVCRSSWTVTSSSAFRPRKPQSRTLKDLKIQGRYGVRFLTYWFDEERQTAFCLAKAPSADAVEEVHRASHGYMAYKIIEVDDPWWPASWVAILEHPPGEVYVEAASARSCSPTLSSRRA